MGHDTNTRMAPMGVRRDTEVARTGQAGGRPENFRDTLAQQNHEFHLQILETARSPRLFSICKNLTQAPLMAGSFHFYDDQQLRRSLGDHREIVTSIGSRMPNPPARPWHRTSGWPTSSCRPGHTSLTQ